MRDSVGSAVKRKNSAKNGWFGGIGAWLCISALSLSVAQAQTPPASADQGADVEAHALYQAAKVAFDQGRYENALDYFQRAYALSPRPALLHNIAVTADLLRRDDVALEAFEHFLRAVPDTDLRSSVEARIRILRAAVTSHATSSNATMPAPHPQPPEPQTAVAPTIATAPAPVVQAVSPAAAAQTIEHAQPIAQAPATVAVPASAEHHSSHALAWTLVGTGVALAAGGAASFLVGKHDLSLVTNAPMGSHLTDLEADRNHGRLLTGVGISLLAAGGAALIVGIVWTQTHSDTPASHLAVGINPNGIVLGGNL